jgi:hypothetical protein
VTEQETYDGAPAGGGRARLTPYELAFGSLVFETHTFPTLLDEAQAAGVDPAVQERFAFLSIGSDALREVVPPDAPPEALDQYRALLFHAFNFWRFGKRLYVIEKPVARYLVEAAPTLQDWDFAMPYPSVYVQLPPNLFWASVSPGSTPEPVDGFFATVAPGDDPLGLPAERLQVLVVLGIRRERAGYSVIPFDTAVGPGITADWMHAPGREGAGEFENVLPGGEISGLYSILTTTEALKLLARAAWYIDRHPDDVIAEDAPAPDVQGRATPSPESRLAYHRVRFGGSGDAD